MFVSCYILRVCVSFQSYAYGDLDEQAATSFFSIPLWIKLDAATCGFPKIIWVSFV